MMQERRTVVAERPIHYIPSGSSGSDSSHLLASMAWVRRELGVSLTVGAACDIVSWHNGAAEGASSRLGGVPSWPARLPPPRGALGGDLQFVGQLNLQDSWDVLPRSWRGVTHIAWFIDTDWSELGDGVELPVRAIPFSIVAGDEFIWCGEPAFEGEWRGVLERFSDLDAQDVDVDAVRALVDEERCLRSVMYSEAWRPRLSRIGGAPCGNSEQVVDGATAFYWPDDARCIAQLVVPRACGLEYPHGSGVATVWGEPTDPGLVWGFL